jgi:hypothetical protein
VNGKIMTEWMEKIYRDQGGQHMRFYDRTISDFYLPLGIQRMDTVFCRRICAYGQGKTHTEYYYSYKDCAMTKQPPTREVDRVWTDTFQSLKKDITENPHLHPEIKKNLMLNLRNKKKERKLWDNQLTDKSATESFLMKDLSFLGVNNC